MDIDITKFLNLLQDLLQFATAPSLHDVAILMASHRLYIIFTRASLLFSNLEALLAFHTIELQFSMFENCFYVSLHVLAILCSCPLFHRWHTYGLFFISSTLSFFLSLSYFLTLVASSFLSLSLFLPFSPPQVRCTQGFGHLPRFTSLLLQLEISFCWNSPKIFF